MRQNMLNQKLIPGYLFFPFFYVVQSFRPSKLNLESQSYIHKYVLRIGPVMF